MNILQIGHIMSEGGLDAPPHDADDVVMSDGEEEVEDGEGMANLSLCDASFSAKDSVPTSDHDRLSKCTEGVRIDWLFVFLGWTFSCLRSSSFKF